MYEQFFGLTDEPFRLTPDPRYLYLSAKHAEALAHLRLGLTDSSGFVCITGDVGTGKTTLVRAFLADRAPNVAAAYVVVPPLSAVDLLRRICRGFDLPAAGASAGELVDELHAYLLRAREAGRLCVVVLDEAQALSVELLEQIRLLLNLETDTQKLLRIVLLGQPQLRRLLLDPGLAQLNQRITLRWHLAPLARRETVADVRHRLAVANGGRHGHLFTRPALRLLHAVSGGIPRLINMIGHRALLAAFVARRPRVSRGLVAMAYREIQALPLPGTASAVRLAAWGAAGLAVGVLLVSSAGPPIVRWLEGMPVRTDAAAPAGPEPVELAAVAAAPALAVPPQAATPQEATRQPAVERPPRRSVAEATAQLAALTPDTSARQAIDAILAAWEIQPLGVDEDSAPAALESAAWRRGLQQVVLTGNRGMLRVLDLPAVLELRLSGSADVRHVALLRMEGADVVLSLDGTPTTLDGASLERVWSGRSYVLWRDFDGLGPVLRSGARGVAVVRVQKLLRTVGRLDGEPTGVFDLETENAVRRFQREHQLDPDGLVGPLTRIVLYREGGRYAQPSLANGANPAG